MSQTETKILAPIQRFIASNFSWGTQLQINLYDGFFICPASKSNWANKDAKHGIVMENLPFIVFYKSVFPLQVEALGYFLKLNGIRLDETDEDQFSTHLTALCYMIAFYKRRLEFADIPSLEMKWEGIKIHITRKNVGSMYNSLLKYLMVRKGLTKTTSREIIYGALQDPSQAITNVLSILANLEEPFFPDLGNPKLRAYYEDLRKKVVTDISRFKFCNPLSDFVGKSMEAAVLTNLPEIQKILQGKFGANESLILCLDSDKSLKKELNQQDQKIPDYIYLDNRLNMLALDSKFDLGFANLRQVQKKALIGIIDTIGLAEYLSAKGYPCRF